MVIIQMFYSKVKVTKAQFLIIDGTEDCVFYKVYFKFQSGLLAKFYEFYDYSIPQKIYWKEFF